ncbi:hypothetical protein B0H14DRAFT_3516387 [Mycena olivaceomarginata]|nr:hypothetical protein B0H14DRAFT_3516387 [Mycena olivaceomarginata]
MTTQRSRNIYHHWNHGPLLLFVASPRSTEGGSLAQPRLEAVLRHTDTEDPKPESVDEDSVVFAVVDISEEEKYALQTVTPQTFRRVCDVVGTIWPDPAVARSNTVTSQVYPTPFFDFKVSDRRNRTVLRDVATQVMTDLQDKRNFGKRD